MKKNKLVLLCIGLLCSFGMIMNVNAESYVASSAPDTFVTNTGDKDFTNKNFWDVVKHDIIDYHTSQNQKVFCLDKNLDFAEGATYKKTGEVVDNKIVYIITHVPTSKGYTDEELSWLTQAAIWYYQSNLSLNIAIADPSLMQQGYTDLVTSEETCTASSQCYSYRTNMLWDEAKALANAAKAANTDVLDSIQFAYDGKYSVDKNNKTIKTSLISILNTGDLKIKLDLSKMPEGTKIYNEAGQETTEVTSATKFYFVIPVNNIENYSIKAKITATISNYEYYKGYKYIHATDNTKQPLVLVVKESKAISGVLNIEASDVPDTASSLSRSIYFVGFIILLCGAGIIYANVKPKKQTNE